MLLVTLPLIKPEKRHLFAPLVKNHPFSWEIVLITKFSCKIGGFWPMGLKDGVFQVWSTREPMVTFLGLKNPSSPYDAFFLGHGVVYTWFRASINKLNTRTPLTWGRAIQQLASWHGGQHEEWSSGCTCASPPWRRCPWSPWTWRRNTTTPWLPWRFHPWSWSSQLVGKPNCTFHSAKTDSILKKSRGWRGFGGSCRQTLVFAHQKMVFPS